MAYGLFARIRFRPVELGTVPLYQIYIKKKDYTGDFTELVGASTPAVQSYESDNPLAPVQASTLRFAYIDNGTVPMNTFIAEEDDIYKVEFIRNGTTIWSGFIQMDDVNEPMVEFNHEIQITATDGIAFLKSIALNNAMMVGLNPEITTDLPVYNYYTILDYLKIILGCTGLQIDTVIYSNIYTEPEPYTLAGVTMNVTAPNKILLSNTSASIFKAGQTITISTSGGLNTGPFVITFAEQSGTTCVLTTSTTVTADTARTATITYNFTQWQFDTMIKATSFTNDDVTYEDCYTILERIMKRFRCCIFQAEGWWRIVHIDEIKYYTDGQIKGHHYDSSFATKIEFLEYPEAITDNTFEMGISQRIDRANKFSREQYNYKQPGILLRNYNLQNLGALITSYVSGSNTISEYQFTYWAAGSFPSGPAAFFIRVVRDTASSNELERYIVISGATGDTARSIVSLPIEGVKGDSAKIEFSFRTSNSQPGNVNTVLAFAIYDGTTWYYADETSRNFLTTLGWTFTTPTGENTNQWQQVEIAPNQLPFDGLIYVFLPQASTTNAETHIRDLRFTYTPVVSESTKVIGHIHKSDQDKIIKNNSDFEIFIDSAPTNNIAGALMKRKNAPTVVEVKPRTLFWYRDIYPSEVKRFGQITTLEQLIWKQKTRVMVEGNRFGSIGSISKMNAVIVPHFPDKVFVTGRMEIDYRNTKITATLYELSDTSDIPESTFDLIYDFSYLYSTK